MKNEKPLILAIDDVADNLKIIWNILNHEGYSVAIASSGFQALENLNKMSPDLILLDIQMPELNGYEVCNILKENPLYKDIPVIFLTAKSSPEDIVKGFESGGIDYITKPFNQHELISRIKTHIDIKLSRACLFILSMESLISM